jgi:hypothetical protein
VSSGTSSIGKADKDAVHQDYPVNSSGSLGLHGRRAQHRGTENIDDGFEIRRISRVRLQRASPSWSGDVESVPNLSIQTMHSRRLYQDDSCRMAENGTSLYLRIDLASKHSLLEPHMFALAFRLSTTPARTTMQRGRGE